MNEIQIDLKVLRARKWNMSNQSLFTTSAYSPITKNVMLSVTGDREKQNLVIRMSKDEVQKVIEILEMMEE